MKKAIVLLILITSCKTIQMPQKEHNFHIPTIDNSFEIFNIEDFKENQVNGRRIIEDDSLTIEQFSTQEVLFFKNSPFCVLKSYSSNGEIKYKGVLFNEGSIGNEKGIWYDYDKEGKLTKETNYDEGYAFTWDDVLNYCVSNKIPITLGYKPTSTYNTSIERMYSKEFKRNIWKITYPDSTGVGIGKGFPMEAKLLDGNTGKVLDTQKGGVLEPREN